MQRYTSLNRMHSRDSLHYTSRRVWYIQDYKKSVSPQNYEYYPVSILFEK